jgi:Flp pilus assembly protein TadG
MIDQGSTREVRMSFIRTIGNRFRALLRCERGSVAPLVGVTIITLIGAVGVAVDIGRGQVALSKLQSALDAAGLAAGAVVGQNLSEDSLEQEARKYFDANFGGQTVDASVTGFQLHLSDDQTIVTLSANATLPTTFMAIFGQKKIDIAARTEITREMSGLEVALVVDVTGSMCMPCQKLADLKTAAHDLTEILWGDNETVDDLWVGIVPFSQAVNVGTSHADWTSDYDERAAKDNCIGTTSTSSTPHCPTTGNNGRATMSSLETPSRPRVSTRTNPVTLVDDWMVGSPGSWYFKPHAWGGCVEERYETNDDVTNATPEDVPFKVYFHPDMSGNPWLDNSNGNKTISNSNDYSANRGCPRQAITPLTNVRETLDDAIDALQAIGVQRTHINLGAVWGWRLLSREWKSAWGGDMAANDLPKTYDDPDSQKAVVLMTDGVNTMTDYTAFGLASEGILGSTDPNSSTVTTTLNNKTAAICDAMKNAGIIVYTVLFQTTDEDVKDMLRDCASQEVFFFDTTTGADLASAFRTIGDSLSKLRVSR